jgi:sporulation protein YlmC with PRC-barrel domain
MSICFCEIKLTLRLKTLAYNAAVMLQLSSALNNIPVVSLRTGGIVAMAVKPIINPNNLKIEGWHCDDKFSKANLILVSKDIRDMIPQGLAIDDHDVLSDPSDLVRLQKVLGINFNLIGKQVMTDTKRKLGKVGDFATDIPSLYVQKLYISQPFFKNLSGSQLIVDRTQILEITNKVITVRDNLLRVSAAFPVAAAAP